MKKKEAIRRSVVEMYEQRSRWEQAKAIQEGKPIMDTGYATPRIEYLPGKGFSVNGVEWPYQAQYIIDHFRQMAADYRNKASELEAENEMRRENDEYSDIPF